MTDTVQSHLQTFALMTPVREVVTRPPVDAKATVSIKEAVEVMAREKCSCLPVVDDDGRLTGIFTDRDLRNRVVAGGVALSEPLGSVMTPNPYRIEAETFGFEALLLMSRHSIHHLPVVDGNRLLGVITTTDLVRLQATSPVYFVGDIRKAEDVEELVALSNRLPQLVRHLVVADAKAEDIGRVVSVFSDALTERLLQLAENRLGEPPVPYAWLAFGSQARQEQSAHSDQDNGLLLSDAYAPEHEGYFAELAKFVSDGLDACGYWYCEGEIMATNPKWRQTLAGWRGYFERWTTVTDPQALLNASIFFDMRCIAGDEELFDALHETVVSVCKGNNRFLGNLASNALSFQPPMGRFGRVKKVKEGEKIDLKLNGVVPIIDLARTYALAYGVTAVNTFDRIRELVPTEAFVEEDGRNLEDALEYIFYVRMQHQGAQLEAGEGPDNFVDPDELSKFEREHLRSAFSIVGKMQGTLGRRYQTNLMG